MASNQSRIKRALEGNLIYFLKHPEAEMTPTQKFVMSNATKYLAVSAKLEESEYGKELMDLEHEQEGGETNESTDDL